MTVIFKDLVKGMIHPFSFTCVFALGTQYPQIGHIDFITYCEYCSKSQIIMNEKIPVEYCFTNPFTKFTMKLLL